MPKLNLTNVRGRGPRGVNVITGGIRLISVGETRTVTVSDAEVDGLSRYFDVAPVDSEEAVEPNEITDAIGALDHTDDSHWTNAGLPAVDALSTLLGRTVTRKEINEAAPDFMRPTEA
jgi:hypothetical protein